MAASILLAHDDRIFLERTTLFLQRAGYRVAAFSDPIAAIATVKPNEYDTVITRIRFLAGKPNGVSFALMLRMKHPGINVVFVARSDDEADTEGIGPIIPHPVDLSRLLEAIRARPRGEV